MRFDFHTHTTASDGHLTPTQLVKLAQKIKLSYLAKTDHDTVNLMHEFLVAGKKYKIHTFPGIEISSKFKNKSVHVVGLNINYKNKKLIQYTQIYQLIRQQRAKKIIAKLKKLNWYIDNKQIQRQIIGRPHIALAVIKHPLNKKRLIKEFGTLPTFGQFISKYIVPGSGAYAPKTKHITTNNAIKLIHQADGLAILAHPLTKSNEFNYTNLYLQQLLKLNFDGIEVYSSEHTPNEIKQLLTLAKKYNLLISGGSDYHDSNNELGKYNHRFLNSNNCRKLIDKLIVKS